MTRRDVWITGIGIVSALGDGRAETWAGLNDTSDPFALVDSETFAPFSYYKAVDVDLSTQIPKRGDQRQMDVWQRLGVYAAGRALDDAGVKNDPELLDRMDMIVAAGGGERDLDVDNAGMKLVRERGAIDAELNEFLATNLRPTLFLAQLPNLLAGNISIVHGVTGSSRTFMGEELSGADAVRIAFSRIAAGQSEMTLVGGAYNGARPDIFLLYELTRRMWRGAPSSVWERGETGGLMLGTGGIFLVLESADHAAARGAKPIARLRDIATDRSRRGDGEALAALGAHWARMRDRAFGGDLGVLSSVTGAEPASGIERSFLDRLSAEAGPLNVRAPVTRTGHLTENQIVFNIAVAALSLDQGKLYAPNPVTAMEPAGQPAIDRALVLCVGQWRGEGMALLDRAES